MKKGVIAKYIGDGLLIVFSVLFALYINKMAEEYALREKEKTALESIRKELETNAAIIDRWQIQHKEIQDGLEMILNGEEPAILDSIRQYDYLELRFLTQNKPLINAVLSKTAWDTAQTTGIIDEFEFETTKMLTNVYTMQDVLMNTTIRGILNLYFDKESHSMDDLMPTLKLFELRFKELVGQENLCKYLYNKSLEELNINAYELQKIR